MGAPVRSAAESVARMTEGEARQWRQRLRERSEATLGERAGERPPGHFEPDLDCAE